MKGLPRDTDTPATSHLFLKVPKPGDNVPTGSCGRHFSFKHHLDARLETVAVMRGFQWSLLPCRAHLHRGSQLQHPVEAWAERLALAKKTKSWFADRSRSALSLELTLLVPSGPQFGLKPNELLHFLCLSAVLPRRQEPPTQ